jgi:DNA-binding NtrC family response regulator
MNKFMDFDEEEVVLPVGKAMSAVSVNAAKANDLVTESKNVMPTVKSQDLVSLAEMERMHIMNVLNHTNGNKSEAAKILGITIKSVYNKLHEYESAGHALGVAAINAKSSK